MCNFIIASHGVDVVVYFGGIWLSPARISKRLQPHLKRLDNQKKEAVP
ncbi:MAG: hypothetical protein ABR607_08355 [Pyrinomonadaceae bacterium]